ncbi:MAG: fumarylacetoacetate hydrolase family protein [Planctomycetaceae bacterium]|jgi:2,4-diketo-3-deoxy-L-fuconate hydrolase
MRICRFEAGGVIQAGFYSEERIVPLLAAARLHPDTDLLEACGRLQGDLLPLLPGGWAEEVAVRLATWLAGPGRGVGEQVGVAVGGVQLLVPIPRPNKLLLLAGNYADHIREGGGIAAERAETFPYVFMKPASTTLTDPGSPLKLPRVSPLSIDWELELAVVIGQRMKGVSEGAALAGVAGYTVINDISDRKFRPNPHRKERPKDGFFDWLHGKWHDGFCPMGPCVTSGRSIGDPQALTMKLTLNGETRQQASTSQMVFPVAAIIAFIASFVTLEPGDIISTGTPAGVGHSTNTFLKPGDVLSASIESIGTLRTPVLIDD